MEVDCIQIQEPQVIIEIDYQPSVAVQLGGKKVTALESDNKGLAKTEQARTKAEYPPMPM